MSVFGDLAWRTRTPLTVIIQNDPTESQRLGSDQNNPSDCSGYDKEQNNPTDSSHRGNTMHFILIQFSNYLDVLALILSVVFAIDGDTDLRMIDEE